MTSSTVEKWLTRQDGLEKVFRGSGPMPSPGPGEVLVKIKTVSLNYRDTEVAMGDYNHHKTISSNAAEAIVMCSDMCGIVVAVGEGTPGAAEWAVGDRVLSIFNQTHQSGQIKAHNMASGLGLPLQGCLQTFRVFPSTGLVKAPEYLTDEEACCLAIAGVTAWMSINGFRPLGHPGGAGETVLLQGTGGVSICGLQIARASGIKTIITSSSNEKLKKAKALGADHLINYREVPDWQDEVLNLTGGEGADTILECGGAKTLRKSFDSVAFGGIIACIGYLSGKQDDPEDRTNVNVLALKRNVTLKGILNGPRDRFQEMLQFYDHHKIRPPVDRVFDFEEAKEGLKYLLRGAHVGKIVIRVQE